MEVPQAVIKAAGELVQMFGPKFDFIGEHNGSDVYRFAFPKGEYTGYPIFYLYDKGCLSVTEVAGPAALELLSLLGVE